MNETVPTGLYRHYKGNTYEVLGVAHHSETLESLVVYKALYDSPGYGFGAIWVRPLAMFMETIELDGEKIQRFAQIS